LRGATRRGNPCSAWLRACRQSFYCNYCGLPRRIAPCNDMKNVAINGTEDDSKGNWNFR
jgi:hypothetical protein